MARVGASGARTGTSVVTTPGSFIRRSLSENAVRCRTAAVSDASEKRSGMATVRNSAPSRGTDAEVLDRRVDGAVALSQTVQGNIAP